MKKKNLKVALAAVCVVAAGFGSMKAYNAANQSETDLLLSENVEALSAGEVIVGFLCVQHPTYACYIGDGTGVTHNINLY